MTDSDIKHLAMSVMTNAGQGKIRAIAHAITDDFTLELMMREPVGDYSSRGRIYDRAGYLEFLALVKELTPEGMNLSFDLAIAEGDDVALFGSSNAIGRNGRVYRNAYCWHLRFSGSKVCLMREYCDTALSGVLLQD